MRPRASSKSVVLARTRFLRLFRRNGHIAMVYGGVSRWERGLVCRVAAYKGLMRSASCVRLVVSFVLGGGLIMTMVTGG